MKKPRWKKQRSSAAANVDNVDGGVISSEQPTPVLRNDGYQRGQLGENKRHTADSSVTLPPRKRRQVDNGSQQAGRLPRQSERIREEDRIAVMSTLRGGHQQLRDGNGNQCWATDESEGDKGHNKTEEYCDFSLAMLSDVIPKGNYAEAPIINLNDKRIASLDDLAPCKALQRIDIERNALTTLEPFKYCHDLRWLNVTRNQISMITDLSNLRALAVLNLSHNKLSRVSGIAELGSLKALILNNNSITSIEGLTRLSSLETLVASHNSLEEFPDLSAAPLFSCMKKLSLAHNKLRAVPKLLCMPNLKELRLNSNKVSSVSSEIRTLGRLEICDLGWNCLRDYRAIENLSGLLRLQNLNLAGNDIVNRDAEEVKKLCDGLKSLAIFNSRRMTPSKKQLKALRAVKKIHL